MKLPLEYEQQITKKRIPGLLNAIASAENRVVIAAGDKAAAEKSRADRLRSEVKRLLDLLSPAEPVNPAAKATSPRERKAAAPVVVPTQEPQVKTSTEMPIPESAVGIAPVAVSGPAQSADPTPEAAPAPAPEAAPASTPAAPPVPEAAPAPVTAPMPVAAPVPGAAPAPARLHGKKAPSSSRARTSRAHGKKVLSGSRARTSRAHGKEVPSGSRARTSRARGNSVPG